MGMPDGVQTGRVTCAGSRPSPGLPAQPPAWPLCNQHLLVSVFKEQGGLVVLRELGFRIKGLQGPCGAVGPPLAHAQCCLSSLYTEEARAPELAPLSIRASGCPGGAGSHGIGTGAYEE